MSDTILTDGEFGTHIDKEGKRTPPVRSALIGEIGVAAREKFAEDMERALNKSVKGQINAALPQTLTFLAQTLAFLERCDLALAEWLLPEGFKIIDTKPLQKVEKFKKEVVQLWSEYEPKDGHGKPMLLHLSVEEDTTIETEREDR